MVWLAKTAGGKPASSVAFKVDLLKVT